MDTESQNYMGEQIKQHLLLKTGRVFVNQSKTYSFKIVLVKETAEFLDETIIQFCTLDIQKRR